MFNSFRKGVFIVNAWNNFNRGAWVDNINVGDFIQTNYTEYLGDESFLTSPTDATMKLWESLTEMVYELQPNCVVHGGSAQNIRWVGNEEGYALEEHWSTVRKDRKSVV